jgi:energy-coupling factor transport system ATP-binding protein
MEVMEKIRVLNEAGTTVVMVCHDMEVVLDFAKEVIVMNRGEILAQGATRDILGNKELLNKARLLPPQIAETAMLLTDAGAGDFKNVFTVEEMIAKIKEAK